MMNRLQDTIAFYEQARQRNFDHIQSRSRGLVAAANQFARHQHHTTISGATISGGVRPPGPELLHARPLLLKDVAFKGKDGNTLHYRPEVLADTGGSFSVIDESTVADMERRGCVGETVRWPAQQREYSMHGVGGIGVTVVGVCTLQFYLRDIETNEWRCYQERFHVIKGAPIFLLGLPFARQNNFVIDVGQNEIVLDAARHERLAPSLGAERGRLCRIKAQQLLALHRPQARTLSPQSSQHHKRMPVLTHPAHLA